MNLLLDTHVLLWWLDDNPALSKKACAAIGNANNLIFVSAAVVWEISGELFVTKEKTRVY